jgi:hypothetical protein
LNPTELTASLVEQLFTPEQRRLNKELQRINTTNKKLKGVSVDGFIHSGIFFLPKEISVTLAGAGQKKSVLHDQLRGEMDQWLRDWNIIRSDTVQVRQTLYQLLKPCRTYIEARNTLPECLASLVPGYASHPRADPVGYTLEGNERATRQFLKCLPKIEIYSAARFIY